jgi:hypothetical protein
MVCSAPSWSRSAGRIGAAVIRRLNWRSGGSDEIDLFAAVLGAASPSSPDLVFLVLPLTNNNLPCSVDLPADRGYLFTSHKFPWVLTSTLGSRMFVSLIYFSRDSRFFVPCRISSIHQAFVQGSCQSRCISYQLHVWLLLLHHICFFTSCPGCWGMDLYFW